MLTFGSLFAGIGGFDLGLERAGMRCEWQVEFDPYAQAVLRKHWPSLRRWDDVRTFPPPEGEWGVDLICGGFPCQDISVAGKGAGLAGERSGLWCEFARIIRVLRPRWVVIENVPALTARGLGTVLGDLAEIGMDAEWHCIPACSVGAPHRRDRIWIVAHSNGKPDAVRRDRPPCEKGVAGRSGDAGGGKRDSGPGRAGCAGESSGDVADASSVRREGRPDFKRGREKGKCKRSLRSEPVGCGEVLADAECKRDQQQHQRSMQWGRSQQAEQAWLGSRRITANGGWWESEPDVGRVAHGVPSRVDRLRCLGNAVVPQVVEIIGRAIIEAEERLKTGAAVESLQRKDAR